MKVPSSVAQEIKSAVYKRADRVNYLARSRVDNSVFLDQLVSSPEVGERLGEFMQKAEVRTYIKDAILNRYSKDKSVEEKPNNLEEIIDCKLGLVVEFMERDARNNVGIYKVEAQPLFVVVSDGTLLKWETALRKALLCIATHPFGCNSNSTTHILLTLFARYQKVPPSDLKALRKALSHCSAIPFVYGDK